jgi:hypothetical protein
MISKNFQSIFQKFDAILIFAFSFALCQADISLTKSTRRKQFEDNSHPEQKFESKTGSGITTKLNEV